ncbi:hypothetical protein [Rhodohalobacter sp. 614A]|uniref:hypothetical protein n=1 Tax=Rhodohalobacter sp. 614A TaxID=2908649 RepID=UPI001F1A8928|nr:hypothetical protein [Rhodohalobacter sp. 614A]
MNQKTRSFYPLEVNADQQNDEENNLENLDYYDFRRNLFRNFLQVLKSATLSVRRICQKIQSPKKVLNEFYFSKKISMMKWVKRA